MKMIKVFKSEEGRKKILACYNQILSVFPFIQKYIKTSFGSTFVLEAGNPESPPIVLLHGSCSNSAAWLGDIPALAEYFHVFAVDIPGEPGNSEENRLDINSNEYSNWFRELLDELRIRKTAIIGNSTGGWLALHFAAACPERVVSLVLLSPSGIILPKQSFLEQTSGITSSPETARSVNDEIFADDAVPKEVQEYMNLIMENFNPIIGALPVLTDLQMCKLKMPVLFVMGKRDITMDTEKAAERISLLLPDAMVKLLDGSHVIMNAAHIAVPFLLKGRGSLENSNKK